MTYAETAQLYVDAGWPVPFPLPAGRKHPPPDGVTGQHGEDLPLPRPYPGDVEHEGNVGLRMPPGVIGIDVDVYADKHGDVVIAKLEDKLGPLPVGPWSSSRAWPSGIRFFRVPLTETGESPRLRGAIPGGVEIIQRHHRYAVVWPSVVEDREYTWTDARETLEQTLALADPDSPPDARDLPELPDAWLAWLKEGAADATGPGLSGHEIGDIEVELFSRTGLCPEVSSLLADADARMLEAAEGGRHDAMTGLAFRLAHLCVAGHLSWSAGTEHLGGLWAQHVGGDRERYGELVRIFRTGLGKAGPVVSQIDPCRLTVGPGYVELEIRADVSAFPPPLGDAVARELSEASPSTIEVAGVSVFDPVAAYDDRALGLAVLAHVGGGVRYLLDAGGWLHRGPEAWSVSGSSLLEGARSCVAVAVRTLPHGRKDAEDGSVEKTRHARHATLTSSAGMGRAAAYLAAEVAAPGSPFGIRLSDLDTDPELLWAGGRAYDLRSSVQGSPAPADVDPGTPHTRSAGVAPSAVPTPLWDAFCAAVWPDPEQRAWALRVLGIAVTGYADRAMPILWGPPGRGKTQVLALVSDVLGSYAVAADPRLLGSGEHHGSVTLALAGARLAWIDEGPRSGHWATERLKALTGGGEMTGNPMRGNPVTFRPSHTLCLTSNDEPQVAEAGLRSRVRSIECTGDYGAVREARRAIGPVRGPAWTAERPGVLAQLMREAAGWLEDPSSADNPVAVEAVLEQLAREQDPVLDWLDERTSPAGWTPSAVLYEDFRLYCAQSGLALSRVPNVKSWGRTLSRVGVDVRRGAQGARLRDRVLLAGGVAFPNSTPPAPAQGFMDGSLGGSLDVKTSGGGVPAATGGVEGGVEPLAENALSLGAEPLSDLSDVELTDLVKVSSKIYIHNNKHSIAEAGGFDAADEQGASGGSVGDAASVAGGANAPGAGGYASPLGVGGLRGVDESAEAGPDGVHAVPAQAGDVGIPGGAGHLASGRAAGLPAIVLRGELGTPPTVHPGADSDTVRALLATLAGQSVTLDVEHSGYPIGHPDYALRTIQLGNANLAVVLDVADVYLAVDALDHASEIVAHASQADVIPVALEAGLDPGPWFGKVTDTAVLGALDDPHHTQTDRGHALDLKGLSGRLLPDPVSPAADKARAAYFRHEKWLTNTEPTTDPARSGWAQADYSEPVMALYAAGDVLDTGALRYALPDVGPELMARERRVLAATARIAARGFRLDADWISEHGVYANNSRAARRLELRDMGAPEPGSPAQLAVRFAELGAQLPRTPKGALSTASDALEDLARYDTEAGRLAAAVLAWREQDKLLGTYLEPYALLCERGDGRVRPTVQTLGAAATGRMSVVRPNLQQVPQKGGIRGCVIADPGMRFVAADFSGVELRVAAALSGDVDLAALIAREDAGEGDGLHWQIARQVWGPEATKSQRYAAKRVVFGKMYGAGKSALARQMGEHGARVDDVIETMTAITPGFAQWSSRLQQEVRSGLRPVWRHPSGRLTYLTQDTPHKAPNYAIQSTARELLVDALARWEAMRPGHTLLPIHDELLVQVPEDQAVQATADLVACMTTELLGVPIVAEADTPSTRWADAA